MSLASESVAEVVGCLSPVVVTPGPDVGTSTPFMCVRDGVFKYIK